ncbi:MAG TPA: aminotransferase class III-fold pyridoxal phosphate-dependent enzyme [Candidatus Lokiarchaeia archaeon]|nr:aminotransferase class III-fold pyridoxal phosphate-dependent enzyme [Candidatus Lokiarchaeia archaeon]
MTSEKTIMGTLPQKELLKMYSEYVSSPKAAFFKDLGLGFVQGERQGIYIKSLEGLRKNQPPLEMIDCRTSGGVFNLGHRHPAIIQALKEGIDAGLDIGDHHAISEQRALLAKKLANLMPPGITKTMFCVGGGEAIDLAIKLARGITGRAKVISATGAYHGVTGLALAAGDEKFKAPFSWHPPDFIQVPFDDIDVLSRVMDDQVACVIFETIPATAGILMASRGYFVQVRELCDKHGTIMIADEVQAGLGRTGHMWGIYGGLYDDEEVIPDIIVLAKGMSAGYYPIATCSYKPFIEKVFDQDPFLHISTTGGAELGCHVCSTMLDIISAPEFLDHVKEVGSQMAGGLNNLASQYSSIVTDVRGRGLMWGVEFINEKYGAGYTLKMIENGVFADYCGNRENTIKLMPPLIITAEEIEFLLSRLEKAMAALPLPAGTTGE